MSVRLVAPYPFSRKSVLAASSIARLRISRRSVFLPPSVFSISTVAIVL